MPRKENARAVEFVKSALAQGKTVGQIAKEARERRMAISKSLIGYYARKNPTKAATPTMNDYATKIHRARKILEAEFLDEDLRVELAQKVLS